MVFGGNRGGRNAGPTTPRDPSDEAFRKIFVGGLNPEVSTEGLQEYFATYGEIVDCIVVKNPVTGRSKGFGFITFKETAAVDAVQAKRPHVIQDKEVEVKRAMPREEGAAEARITTAKLFVGSLPTDATEDDLRSQFAQFGDIESVEIARSRDTNESRGFGFVNFADYDSVDKAMLHRPHSIKDTGVNVRKGLSREEMQRLRARQQQQYHQQSPYQQYPSYPQQAYGYQPAYQQQYGGDYGYNSGYGGSPASGYGYGGYQQGGGAYGGPVGGRGGSWRMPYGQRGGRGRGQ